MLMLHLYNIQQGSIIYFLLLKLNTHSTDPLLKLAPGLIHPLSTSVSLRFQP